MPEYIPSLTEEENAWLLELMRDIWKPVVKPSNPRDVQMPPDIKRVLKKSEVNKLFELIKTRHLVCVLSGHGFFSAVALHVLDQASDPDDEPRHLVTIIDEHLNLKAESPNERFKEGFRIFNEIATTPLNLQFLDFYELEKPKPISHYAY